MSVPGPASPMRILLISTRDPRGPMSGRKMILTTIVQSLIGLGHRVTVAYFGKANAAPEVVDSVRYVGLPRSSAPEEILKLGLAFLFGHQSLNEALYDNSRARREIEAIVAGERFDLVITDMIRTAHYGASTGLPWIADLDDLLSARYAYLAARPDRADNLIGYHQAPLVQRLTAVFAKVLPVILRREAKVLTRRENWVVANADFVTVVSSSEAAALSSRSGKAIGATPMAVAAPAHQPQPIDRQRELVFVGGLDYGPNFTSLRDFSQKVIPELNKRGLDDFQLDVIGVSEPKHRQGLPPSIALRGYIEDLDRELQSYRAMLVPEVVPGGVKTKIIAAAMNGTIVLAHVTALDGMDIDPDGSVLAWSTPAELADLIARLRAGQIDLAALSEKARDWAQRRYGRTALRVAWAQNIRRCLAASAGRRARATQGGLVGTPALRPVPDADLSPPSPQ